MVHTKTLQNIIDVILSLKNTGTICFVFLLWSHLMSHECMFLYVCLISARRIPSAAGKNALSAEARSGGSALPERRTSHDGLHVEEGQSAD